MNNSKILATVNGMPITEADVDIMVNALMQHGQNVNNEQGRKMVLEQFSFPIAILNVYFAKTI